MQEVIFTEDQLQQKCSEWQKRLRLQDWIVKARMCRAHELPVSSMAHVHYVVEKKMASIRIVDPVDYPPDSMVPYDMENSLVHELLHLHFAPLTGDESSVVEEQAIECITSALLNANRPTAYETDIEQPQQLNAQLTIHPNAVITAGGSIDVSVIARSIAENLQLAHRAAPSYKRN